MSTPAAAAVEARPRSLLEGWQLGLLAVSMAALAAWLALPRPVAPSRLPLPELDRRELSRLLNDERARAARAREGGLEFDVRAVGELVRRHGLATAEGDAHRALRAEQDAQARAREIVRGGGANGLLALRAVQSELFVAALLASRRAPGTADRELSELAGNFLEKAQQTGWFVAAEPRLSEAELHVLYRVRWTKLLGLQAAPALRLTLSDYRAYYGVLLRYPEGDSEAARNARRLSYVDALARRDGHYPRKLARGVLLYRLGQPAAAAAELLEHVRQQPDGPWALRAKNYALAALAEVPSEE